MALPTAFLEDLRARSPLPELIGRRVRLARSGRQWKGCCPFHDEKTPSFYVYDDHFHCFGCGAHGDAISFVMQSQGLGFMEAVGQLAAASGLEVPQPSPEAAAAEQSRQDLFSVLDAAAAVFARRLFLPEGKAALAYLTGRGLTLETIREFKLGWSGAGRGGLGTELARNGVDPARMAAAGLSKEVAESTHTEFFFNRVMFPILDTRGRIVSFGGRVLGDGQPKYLNGPETEVFAKRRALYGLHRAREHLKSNPPIVVEGYMDVIALHQAGFPTAVAPLGTALTEEQLALLWRYAEAPVICFDGDDAGRRAMARAIDLALPLLAPDQRLAFALLDEGEDPDSLVRKGGAAALGALVRAPLRFEDAHFMAVRGRTGDASWDERAKLLAALKADANRISDATAKAQYRRELERRFYQRYPSWPPSPGQGPRRGPLQGFPRGQAGRAAPPAGRAIAIAHRQVDSRQIADLKRARHLAAILVQWPELLRTPRLSEAYEALELTIGQDGLRQAILDKVHGLQEIDSKALLSALRAAELAAEASKELAAVLLVVPKTLTEKEAAQSWWDTHGRLARLPALTVDKAASERALKECFDQRGTEKLIAIRAEEDTVVSGGPDEEAV